MLTKTPPSQYADVMHFLPQTKNNAGPIPKLDLLPPLPRSTKPKIVDPHRLAEIRKQTATRLQRFSNKDSEIQRLQKEEMAAKLKALALKEQERLERINRIK